MSPAPYVHAEQLLNSHFLFSDLFCTSWRKSENTWGIWCVNRLSFSCPFLGCPGPVVFLGKTCSQSHPLRAWFLCLWILSLLVESQDSFREVVFSKHKKECCRFCSLYSPKKDGARDPQPSSSGAYWIWSRGAAVLQPPPAVLAFCVTGCCLRGPRSSLHCWLWNSCGT